MRVNKEVILKGIEKAVSPITNNWKAGKKFKACVIGYLYLGVVVGVPMNLMGYTPDTGLHETSELVIESKAEESTSKERKELKEVKEIKEVKEAEKKPATPSILSQIKEVALDCVGKNSREFVKVCERENGVYEVEFKATENFTVNSSMSCDFADFKELCEGLKGLKGLKGLNPTDQIICYWNGDLYDGHGVAHERTWYKLGISYEEICKFEYDKVTTDKVVKGCEYVYVLPSLLNGLEYSDTYGFLK